MFSKEIHKLIEGSSRNSYSNNGANRWMWATVYLDQKKKNCKCLTNRKPLGEKERTSYEDEKRRK